MGAWNGVKGFWEASANSFRGSGYNLSDWLSTGPTPDFRFVVGNEVMLSGAVSSLLIGGEAEIN